MTLEVRETGPEDWHVRRQLRLAALKDSPEAFYTTYEQVSERTENEWRGWPSGGALFAAWLSGSPVGLVGIGEHFDHATGTTIANGSADLFAMWVAPAARGSGAADALIRSALDWAAKAGMHTVELEVARGNERAERVYLRHGFVRHDGTAAMEGGLCLRFRVVTSDEDPAQRPSVPG